MVVTLFSCSQGKGRIFNRTLPTQLFFSAFFVVIHNVFQSLLSVHQNCSVDFRCTFFPTNLGHKKPTTWSLEFWSNFWGSVQNSGLIEFGFRFNPGMFPCRLREASFFVLDWILLLFTKFYNSQALTCVFLSFMVFDPFSESIPSYTYFQIPSLRDDPVWEVSVMNKGNFINRLRHPFSPRQNCRNP